MKANDDHPTCPKCGNSDIDNLFAIKGFQYEDMKLPLAYICGECCHIDVMDVKDDNGEEEQNINLCFKRDKY